MICILCYECNSDCISLSSDEGNSLKISSVLFKYFRSIFELEPVHGDICRKCWLKVEMFHVFYQRIEEIQTTIINVDPLVIENIDCLIKSDDDSHQTGDNAVNTADDKVNVSDESKYTPQFEDDFWQDDYNESHSSRTSPVHKSTSDNVEVNQNRNKRCLKGTTVGISQTKTSKTMMPKKIQTKKIAKVVKSDDNYLRCIGLRKCPKKFETKDALIAHCALEHKRFHCSHCPNTRVFADLYKHMRDCHDIIENAICEHCGQIFGCNRTLQDHIKRKHTVIEPVQCDICKEWFKSRETIRSHMNYVHIQGTSTCPICGKVSANRKALRSHLTIHSDAWKDKYKCVICGKGFRSSTKLREHSYIHSGKTDAYICQFCGKSFRFNSSISSHRMKYHPAEMAHVKERLQKKRNMEFKV